MDKKRTIPQLELYPLSGDCTLCVFDRVTLESIIRLWTVTLYPSTWLVDGYSILDLRKEYGLDDSRTQSAIQLRDDILQDFERGIMAGCDVASIIQVGFDNLDARLSSLQTALASAIRQSACCDDLTAGIVEPSTPLPDVGGVDNPELCRRVRYVQWLTMTFFEKYFAPVLSTGVVGMGALIVGTLTSVALPPYSTTLPEIALLVVELASVVGGYELALQIIDAMPAIFDEIYCQLRDNGTGNGAIGWVSGIVASIVDSEPVSTLISWILGASGAINNLIGIDALSIPPGFEYEGCHCSTAGNYEYVSSTPGGEYQPNYSVGNCNTDGRYTGVGGNAVVTFNLSGWSTGSTIVTVSYALYSTLNTASAEIVIDGQTIVTDTGNTCNGVIIAGLPPTYDTVQVIFRENNSGSGIDVAILGVEWSE